jgi:hypothetical protein
MSNRIFKAILSLALIAVVFAGIGCAGRDKGNDRGSTATVTPTPVPADTGHLAATATPAPTIQPGNAGNYTTNLSPDDVFVSNGDEQDVYPEDSLPTPPAE